MVYAWRGTSSLLSKNLLFASIVLSVSSTQSIIDRFGKDVMMIPADEEHFTVNVNVYVSRQFLGWVFSLGEGIQIIGSEEVVEQMKAEAERMIRQYGCSEKELSRQ